MDYGEGPMVRWAETGKYRRTRLFLLTLAHSRKAVRLLTWKSSAPVWCELHERAFRRLGGAPAVIVLDNLKEGVLTPDLYDPALNPLYRDVLAHYGAIALPCRVGDPDRKGQGRIRHRPYAADTAAGAPLRHPHRLDRLLHHAHVLKCGPKSWRTKVHTDLRTEDTSKQNSPVSAAGNCRFCLSRNCRFSTVHRGLCEWLQAGDRRRVTRAHRSFWVRQHIEFARIQTTMAGDVVMIS
jgi:hypothetical protein